MYRSSRKLIEAMHEEHRYDASGVSLGFPSTHWGGRGRLLYFVANGRFRSETEIRIETLAIVDRV